MSGLAVIAFLLSLASIFLSAGVAAVVLGVLSLRRISRSDQMLKGRRLAKIAIVLPITVAGLLLLVSTSNMHMPDPALFCGTNLSGLGKAMLVYAHDHNDQLPTPSQWCDLLVSVEGVEPRGFRCPGTRPWFSKDPYPLELYLYLRYRSASPQHGPCDYAMNEPATVVASLPDVVLCFEAGPGWNQAGGPEMLTTDNHDGRGCNVMFLDTHVEFVPAEKLGRLKWKPPE